MNFRRILSKSSLRTSSGKSISDFNEIKKLDDEIKSLKLNISLLKVLLESKDASIGKIAREKEKLYVELKSIERTNKKLQQELLDERLIHSKEKDVLLENMKKLLKLSNSVNLDDILGGEKHISALQNEIKSKDEVIYNICSKYCKLRKSKEDLQNKFEALQTQAHETSENIITTLKDNKNSLDSLLDDIRKSAKINPSYTKYIKLIKINAKLNFENTQLKLFLIDNKECFSRIKEVKVPDPQCSRSHNRYKFHKNLQFHESSHSVEKKIRPRKCSVSKVVEYCSKLKNINEFSKYNSKIRYRSMSDSLLSRNFDM